MREDEQPGALPDELLERLRALETSQSDSLAEVAYARARDALDRALDEARKIRVQAIEDARNSRERELTATLHSLRNLREAADAQIGSLLHEAELDAEREREKASAEIAELVAAAHQEAERIRAEAAEVIVHAEERRHEIEQLEREFNQMLDRIAELLEIRDRPNEGWLRRLSHRERK